MSGDSTRLMLLRATEAFCLSNGVDALSLAALARSADVPLGVVSDYFQDEVALLDAVLERHQSVYERAWEPRLGTITRPRDALTLLAGTIASLVEDEDGGPAYVAIAAQMSISTRYALTGRPATTSPIALRLIGILMGKTTIPFELLPIRFDRFAIVLFSSVFSWYRQGAARLDENVFVEDLVDTLEFLALGTPSRSATSR